MSDPMDEPELETPKRHSVQHAGRSNRLKKVLYILGVVVFAAAIIIVALKVFKKSPTHKPASVASAPTATAPVTLPKDVPDAGTTKPYENTSLSLKLNYPDTWKLTETADAGVRIESPGFNYASASKGSLDGYFRIYIRKGARANDSTYIGRGVAIDASQKLTYTQPALNQRKDTLLSLFGLDAPDNFSYFFIAGNFQLKKGDTLGPDYGKEAGTYIVTGGFSDASLKDDMATNAVAPDLLTTSNAYKQALATIASLQLN